MNLQNMSTNQLKAMLNKQLSIRNLAVTERQFAFSNKTINELMVALNWE